MVPEELEMFAAETTGRAGSPLHAAARTGVRAVPSARRMEQAANGLRLRKLVVKRHSVLRR
jgi:hypothetical protein